MQSAFAAHAEALVRKRAIGSAMNKAFFIEAKIKDKMNVYWYGYYLPIIRSQEEFVTKLLAYYKGTSENFNRVCERIV